MFKKCELPFKKCEPLEGCLGLLLDPGIRRLLQKEAENVPQVPKG